jgi:O-acetyl-ADP-ribose deacetylase (regulator of RNase III)
MSGLPEVGSSLLGLDVLAAISIEDTILTACRGSVLDFTGAAIVNAANERMLGGGGLDGAISHAGGDEMYAARSALPILDETDGVRCRTGDAVTTIGGDLTNEWCIHAVGPNYYRLESLEEGDELLASAYRAVMREAKARNIPSLGICLLSAGIYRGDQSLRTIIQIAVKTIADYVYPGLQHACICAFTREEIGMLRRSLESLSKIRGDEELDSASEAANAESSLLDDGMESSGGCKRKLRDSKLSSPSHVSSSAAEDDEGETEEATHLVSGDQDKSEQLEEGCIQDSSKQGDAKTVDKLDENVEPTSSRL